MIRPLKHSLGIVIYDRTIAVSQVERRGDTTCVRQTAEFEIPDGVTMNNLSACGEAFGEFLVEHKFRSAAAVVGISAGSVMAAAVQVPPIQDSAERVATIRMNLERRTELELSEIAVDLWGNGLSSAKDVLVLSTLNSHVNEIRRLCQAVTIPLATVTVTTVGLEDLSSQGSVCTFTVYDKHIEMMCFEDNRLRAIQSIPVGGRPLSGVKFDAVIARQIHAVYWDSAAETSGRDYYIWDCATSAWTHQNGLDGAFDVLRYRVLKETVSADAMSRLCSYATVLGQRAVLGRAFEVDFLNSRLEPKNQNQLLKHLPRIVLAVVAVMVVIGALFVDSHSDRVEIASLKTQMEDMSDSVTQARGIIDRVGYAKQWFNDDPEYLNILRELTLVFPESGDIWLNSMVVDESGNQVITGRATAEPAVLDVLENLQSSKVFEDVKMLYLRKIGKNTDMLTFAINMRSQSEGK